MNALHIFLISVILRKYFYVVYIAKLLNLYIEIIFQLT